jgi:hypothetical protein
MPKLIMRPDLVHQLREMKNGIVTSKCGLTDKSDKLRTTAWHTDVTCDECSP